MDAVRNGLLLPRGHAGEHREGENFPGCLFCHSNGASEDPKNETAYGEPIFPNGYGIGCQRCHGPGGEHVKDPGKKIQTEAGKLDPTIVNKG